MSQALPIVCSLSPTDLLARLSDMARLGADALLDARLDGTAAQLRFLAGDGVRDRLQAIVTAESRCCAFLTMQIVETPTVSTLTIEAPEGAEPVLAELVGAFTAHPVAR